MKKDNAVSYTPIEENEFLRLYKKKKSIFLKGIKKEYLSSSFAKINTKDFIRPSKEVRDNYHFYDLVLNNSKSWKNYPKRMHSIIGTTSYEVASFYSIESLYFVIPISGEVIICPHDDIMNSFQNDFTRPLMNDKYISYPLQFNFEMRDFFKSIDFSDLEIRNLTYEQLIEHLNLIDYYKLKFLSPTLERIAQKQCDPEKLLSKLFSPEINGFIKQPGELELFSKGNGAEVFASGNIILCKYDAMSKLGINPLD